MKYTFFYRKDSPFSQWHPSKFQIKGITFNCAEQYMMYRKALMFDDYKNAHKIMKTTNPFEQKYLGRKVKNFDQKIWHKKCKAIVKKGNMAKFNQNKKLKKHLMKTGKNILVEASPVDCIWGIGYSADNPNALKQERWRGLNWLGFILTEIRDEFKKESMRQTKN